MQASNLILIVSLGLLGACAKPKFNGNTNSSAPPVPATPSGPTPSNGNTPLPKSNPTNPDSGTTDIVKACKANAANLKSVTQAMSFPERKGCRWNENGNLNFENEGDKIAQEHVQAREDQVLTLNLPEGTLCEVEIASNAARIRYDDFLVLTLENHVLLASNRELLGPMGKVGDVFLWDFNAIKGKGINWDTKQYCLGVAQDADDCKVPATETEGLFALKIAPEAIAPVSSAIDGKASAALTLISTGDNDPDKDCAHTQIDLNVNLRYIPK